MLMKNAYAEKLFDAEGRDTLLLTVNAGHELVPLSQSFPMVFQLAQFSMLVAVPVSVYLSIDAFFGKGDMHVSPGLVTSFVGSKEPGRAVFYWIFKEGALMHCLLFLAPVLWLYMM